MRACSVLKVLDRALSSTRWATLILDGALLRAIGLRPVDKDLGYGGPEL